MTGTAVATKIAKIVGSKPTLELPDIGAGLGAGGLLGGAGVQGHGFRGLGVGPF